MVCFSLKALGLKTKHQNKPKSGLKLVWWPAFKLELLIYFVDSLAKIDFSWFTTVLICYIFPCRGHNHKWWFSPSIQEWRISLRGSSATCDTKISVPEIKSCMGLYIWGKYLIIWSLLCRFRDTLSYGSTPSSVNDSVS